MYAVHIIPNGRPRSRQQGNSSALGDGRLPYRYSPSMKGPDDRELDEACRKQAAFATKLARMAEEYRPKAERAERREPELGRPQAAEATCPKL